MNPVQTPTAELLQIVRGEFQELPGLRLTKAQIQRLWALDSASCNALLDVLVQTRFLRRTSNGNYARAEVCGFRADWAA